ncbi:unnamed protein product [Triticum turgidum subsp. durum]|uniref:Uncharacterized protein n=1 Tax=Triticum turgidum subsp. durum TaxID=4567 RepID=A0A9R0TMM9_TRITD|nr:unnamed protein product [Triticum turgidum subsp. durum]
MSSSFKPNPLSLSVPDPALDRWLRDSGYLDLLDPLRASPPPTSPRPPPPGPSPLSALPASPPTPGPRPPPRPDSASRRTYRMPMSLLGLLASLAVWEAVRYCRKRWELATRAPGIGQALLHCAQIANFVNASSKKNATKFYFLQEIIHMLEYDKTHNLFKLFNLVIIHDAACFSSEVDSLKLICSSK